MASLTNLIARARVLLRDKNAVHYTDGAIALAFVEAVRALTKIRPEARYSNGCLIDIAYPTTETEAASFVVPVEERWYQGLIYHAVAKCLEGDVVDSVNNQLSAQYAQKAQAEFML